MTVQASAGNRILFVSHGGGPLPLLGDPSHEEMVQTLKEVTASIVRPAAIVVISAHWEAPVVSVTTAAQPPLIYDYYGFPPASYQLQYPAPGNPALGQQIVTLMQAEGIPAQADPVRGYDHGLFVPLLLMYPDAAIPCIQISLQAGLDPALHIRMGEALRQLHDANLLIIGSGFSFHNMQAFFAADTPQTLAMNQAFEDWLQTTCCSEALTEAERKTRLLNWQQAPHARYCHPREEHLIPLLVCYGAAGTPCTQSYHFNMLHKKASMYLW